MPHWLSFLSSSHSCSTELLVYRPPRRQTVPKLRRLFEALVPAIRAKDNSAWLTQLTNTAGAAIAMLLPRAFRSERRKQHRS